MRACRRPSLSSVSSLALALIACEVDKTQESGRPSEETGEPADLDGDGWYEGEDCADNDPDRNPGALELCDGTDNDCDGAVDEEVQQTWYGDTDADGYGDAEVTTESCERPEGYVPTPTDCDDDDASAFPGAPERCDEADNDCDGEIDEDLASTWYVDDDGDGFGDAARETCEDPGAGYVREGGDCDDADASAFPGAVEICDGADDDCDGEIDEEAEDAITWWEDLDADGYGDPASETTGCEPSTGAVYDATDCDDADAEVYPGAEETCDGVDDDCDGEIDESWLSTDLDDGLPAALTLSGDAAWTSLGTDGFLRLTDVEDGDDVAYDEAGAAMYTELMTQDLWRISVTFEISDGVGVIRPDGRTGSGGDGLALVLLDGADADWIGEGGEYLGYRDADMPGLAVELDTFCNANYSTSECYYTYSSYGDPSGNHLALVDVQDMEHLSSATDIPELEDTGAYGLTVTYEAGTVTAELTDGTDTWTLAEDLPFTPSGGLRVGFTAGTGWEINRHEIDDLDIGCP